MLSLQLRGALYSTSKNIKAKDIPFLSANPEKLPDATQKMMSWMEENAIFTCIRGCDCEGYPLDGGVLFGGQPYISYFVGDMSLLNKKKLGIVGPRTPSLYGIDVMRDLSAFLGKYDLVTVSGGAEGVDMIAHRYSLDMRVPTIVVLGAGIRRSLTHSSSKRFLYDVLDHGGLIYSSFKLDQCPTRFSFPQRNKYIAGMSTCLFVPEAGIGSGSLITVDFAATMRTPCYSVPQSIYASSGAGVLKAWSEGKLSLIHSFETIFSHFMPLDRWAYGSDGVYVGDISEQMPLVHDDKVVYGSPVGPQDVVSQQIWSLLQQKEPLSADEIMKVLQCEPSEVLGLLTMGEIEGFWRELSDGTYQRC